MKQYNVGDVVTIRKDLDEICAKWRIPINDIFRQYIGREARVTRCHGEKRFRIDIDGELNIWTSIMFEGGFDEPMFKAGDLVRVRYGLKQNHYYGQVYFNDDMENLCGQEFVVDHISYNGKATEGYIYSLRNAGGWSYTAEMLESTFADQFDDSDFDLVLILGGAYAI